MFAAHHRASAYPQLRSPVSVPITGDALALSVAITPNLELCSIANVHNNSYLSKQLCIFTCFHFKGDFPAVGWRGFLLFIILFITFQASRSE